jgi:hypothetical protein
MNTPCDIYRQLRQSHRRILRRRLVAAAEHRTVVRVGKSSDDGLRSRRRERRQLRRLARNCKEKTVLMKLVKYIKAVSEIKC